MQNFIPIHQQIWILPRFSNFSWFLNKILLFYPKISDFGPILLGIIANIFRNAINYHCAKFHAFIKKWTIKPFFDNNPLDYMCIYLLSLWGDVCIILPTHLFLHNTYLAKSFKFLVRRDESPENYCHSPGVVVVVVVVGGVVVRRQKL